MFKRFYRFSLIKQVAEYLGLPTSYVCDICKKIDDIKNKYPHAKSLSDILPLNGVAIYNDQDLLDYYKSDVHFQNIVRVAEKLENNVCSVYTHPCSIVIGKKAMDKIPIAKIDSINCLQIQKEELFSVGVIDIDILELNTLKKVKNCLSMIQTKYGHNIVFNINDCNDENTYKLLSNYDVQGIFQFSSNNIGRQLVKKFKIKSLENIVALNILIYRDSIYERFAHKCEDKEVQKIVQAAYKRTGLIIKKYRHKLDEIAGVLLDK